MTDRAPTREELVERLRAQRDSHGRCFMCTGEEVHHDECIIGDTLRYLDSLSQPSERLDAIAAIVWGFAEDDGADPIVGKVQELYDCYREASEKLAALSQPTDAALRENKVARNIIDAQGKEAAWRLQRIRELERALDAACAAPVPTDAALRESIEVVRRVHSGDASEVAGHALRVCDAAARAIHADGEEAGEKIANYLDAAGQPGHAQVVREGWGIGSAARAKGEG